ncbi:hypothetical protein AMS68_002729 [Peltaster fructicola]|uniref:Rrn9 domain-containing protein n=1 Tax=Peltaster fructicola TaxID=286661 RepID=A0A6H0XR15_9PEZI|nr:hypothetical protein AMS68_002729 [Peltaster fructicola]
MDVQSQESVLDSYKSELDRENAFSGRAEIWLGYIVDERDLAESIDLDRANDLSLHLYNAHAIKAKYYDSTTQQEGLSLRNKQQWLRAEPDGTIPWTPPQSWTAWPMSANDVPRPEERHGNLEAMRTVDDQFLKMQEPWFPSADLEQEVFALLLRTAKGQIQKNDRQLNHRVLSSLTIPNGTASVIDIHSSSPARKTAEGEDVVDEPVVDPAPPYQLTDDDDHARQLLMPTTRHILSNLEDLLLALHKSRASGNTASETTTVGPFSRKRKRSSTVDRLNQIDTAGVDRPDVPVDGTPRESRTRQLPTRDWSEVLGIASIAGIDNEVVMKTARRCSVLFKEDMIFDNNPEHGAGDSAEEALEISRACGSNPEMENKFTEREAQVMAYAWQCVDEVKMDYEKLATLCGYTNVRSASNAWSAIRKKLNSLAATGATDADAASTPKSSTKKRTKAGSDDATPAKRSRKAGKVKHEQTDDAEDGGNADEATADVKAEESMDKDETME